MKPFKTDHYPGSCYSAAFRSQGRWVTYSHGSHRNGGNPITNNSLFDLASLTKVVCTLPLCLILIKEKQFDLGKKIKFSGKDHIVEDLETFDFSKVKIAFFAAGSAVAEKWAPIAAKNTIVIDNSKYFRKEYLFKT